MQGMIVALKKKIAKKTKTKKTRKKPYFGKAAHAAVVEYQESDCKKEKNTIYEILGQRYFIECKKSFVKVNQC